MLGRVSSVSPNISDRTICYSTYRTRTSFLWDDKRRASFQMRKVRMEDAFNETYFGRLLRQRVHKFVLIYLPFSLLLFCLSCIFGICFWDKTKRRSIVWRLSIWYYLPEWKYPSAAVVLSKGRKADFSSGGRRRWRRWIIFPPATLEQS